GITRHSSLVTRVDTASFAVLYCFARCEYTHGEIGTMVRPFTSMDEPITVSLSANVVRMAPGAEPVILVVDTRNSGSTVDQYRVEVDGLDPSWYTVLVKSVPLFPGDAAQVPIKLHPP